MKMYKLILLIFVSLKCIYIRADSLKHAVDIAGYGMRFQSERLKIVAENIANEDSVGNTAGSIPYQRKIILIDNKLNKKLQVRIPKIQKISVDKSPFILKFDPNHPAADEAGYVKYPNITKEIERANALEAQRSYEANLSVIEVTNNLIQKTIDSIGR